MRWLGLAVAACLQALALALPNAQGWADIQASSTAWYLQWLGMTALCWVLYPIRPQLTRGCAGGVFLRVWFFASCWLVAVLWWLFISMHQYGGLAAPLALAAVLSLCVALAFLYALAFAIGARWFLPQSGLRPWTWPLWFASCWTLAELARGQLLTGLPWGAIGYAHVDSPLSALAPWVGVYGMGWVAAGLAALTAQVLYERTRTSAFNFALGLLGVAMLCWGLPHLLPQHAAPNATWPSRNVAITLLQGNIPQHEKFERGRGVELALAWYAQQIERASTPIVMAPETAVPLLPSELDAGYWRTWLESPVLRQGGAVMAGLPLGNARDGFTNSVAVVDQHPQAERGRFSYRYDKRHLVPFGEFIPPLFRWFTDLMHIPLGDFKRGADMQPTWQFMGLRWAPNICFEDVFGEELARGFVGRDDPPDVLVNFSNIGWFGQSSAVPQHLHISRMRTLELARPMVRVTNTGASAVINDQGHVVYALPAHQRVSGVAQVAIRSLPVTPYARWAGWLGLWPLWLLCGVGLLYGRNRGLVR